MSEQDFFTVHHSLTANIEPLDADFVLPSAERFIAEIPMPFLVASEFSQQDQLADQARLELRNSNFKQVIALLDAQNEKLNLLLSFILAQQDEANYRCHTLSFGASQFSYLATEPVTSGQLFRAKLFLETPAAAIYCYAHATDCQPLEDGYEVTMRYDHLRDVDEDLLIKAALHQQQKLLRQRSLQRDNK